MEPEAFLRTPVGGDAEASWGLSAAAEGAGFMMAWFARMAGGIAKHPSRLVGTDWGIGDLETWRPGEAKRKRSWRSGVGREKVRPGWSILYRLDRQTQTDRLTD